jgi:MerC mercury resistance protein
MALVGASSMRTLKLQIQLDDVGTFISGLCLVHCLGLPVLLALAPTLMHAIPGDEDTHRFLAFLVVSAGLPSFWRGFRKHRKKNVLVAGMTGMAIILGALFIGDRFASHSVEIAMTMLGSSFLTVAHLLNKSFCRKCAKCDH